MTTRRRVLALLPLLLLLGGCAAAPGVLPTATPSATPSASPTATVTVTPTPSPTPTAAVVAEIVLKYDSFDLVGEDGSTRALSLSAPADVLVDALTDAIGSEPEVGETDGGLETPPTTTYSWERAAVELWDADPPQGSFPDAAEYRTLRFRAPTVGDGVVLRTAERYRVGDPVAPIRQAEDTPVEVDAFFTPLAVELGPELGEAEVPYYPNALAVVLSVEEAGADEVVLIQAPYRTGVATV